ncbi:hypothetical protein QR680_001703 [Steinernema hermaphroditum]|uniref:Uncharacterized protein n=1 Tax=Steinernema hermaphroditum TaxID=289476 RepID=A0AA39LGN2_9BILA|nr:hypothetical protein QR680_001703 [Steinernema hermaphroditum]
MRRGIPEIRTSASAPTLNLSQLSTSKRSSARPSPSLQTKKNPPIKKAASSSKDSPSGSSDSEEPAIPRADIIAKLRSYDHEWFKEICETHPEYFIDSKQYACYERCKR